jgi:crotonobetaine/carnitine-CoA ligase
VPVTPSDIATYQFQGQDVAWLLDHWAEHKPDHPFLVWEPRDGTTQQWTYAEFATATKAVAAGLAANGICEGDTILIHADNCPEAVITWYAAARIGAVSATTNTRSVAAELTYFIEHSGAKAVITQPEYVDVIQSSGVSIEWIAVTGEIGSAHAGVRAWADLHGDPNESPVVERDALRPVGILFTSGTTSKPKAVVHTHGNVCWAAKVNPVNISFGSDDVYLAYLPFFHVNTQGWAIWTVLGTGGTVVLQPKFSASRFWEVIQKHTVTHISLIPFVFKAIANDPIPEHSVKVGVFGLIMPMLDAWLGMRVIAAYGMTELVTHCVRSNPWEHYPDMAMGKVAPGYEMIIVDPDTGELVAPGGMGEIWIRGIRGISVFLEYLNNEEANEKMFTEDGWCRTGDIVRLEADGNIFYCDRDKDALKVGGENVSAREVEDVCRTVPGIEDIAVVAQQHEMLDMVPVAFVIPNGFAAPPEEMSAAIIEACRTNLADFKVPRAVYFLEEFPTAELGKIAKKDLRELANSYVGNENAG